MKTHALFALASALTAMPAAAQAPYRAAGDSPRWTLSIARGLLRYRDAQTRLTTAAPVSQASFNGVRYVTPRITVDITNATCVAADGRRYHDQVIVLTPRRRVTGCGGALVTRANPPHLPMGPGPGVAALDGSSWRIASVGGVPAATARSTAIHFRDGRVEGNAGCNTFGGSYNQRGPVLVTGHITSTRMACVGPGNIEGQVFRILTGPAQLAFRGGDTLIVTTGDDSMTLARIP